MWVSSSIGVCAWGLYCAQYSGPRSVSWRRLAMWSRSVCANQWTHGLSESSGSWYRSTTRMLSVIKLQGVKVFSADPAYTPLTECQAANGMVLNATPQKKCAVKWVKWNDGHQQLVAMRCKVSSCGSYAEWHCGINLSISRCSCWMCVKCCSAVGWKWPWECRSSKLQVASQQSVLMYHCWPSNCRKDDIGSHILLHLTRACFFQRQHQGHQSTCRQSVMMSSINLSAVMSAVMLSQFSCSVKQCAVPVVN